MPLDSPELSGFVEPLDEINALADSAPGCVWRLMSAAGDATTVEHPFDTADSAHESLIVVRRRWVVLPSSRKTLTVARDGCSVRWLRNRSGTG
ncbi:MAG: DUF3291 domain-containing protein [Proteobacteria bacterium]|nr:DUF3291 domain-containing protein [Pseudomonadota bacterium]